MTACILVLGSKWQTPALVMMNETRRYRHGYISVVTTQYRGWMSLVEVGQVSGVHHGEEVAHVQVVGLPGEVHLAGGPQHLPPAHLGLVPLSEPTVKSGCWGNYFLA